MRTINLTVAAALIALIPSGAGAATAKFDAAMLELEALQQGDFEGIFYNDSDVFKVVEGACYSLAIHHDPELEAYLDKFLLGKTDGKPTDGQFAKRPDRIRDDHRDVDPVVRPDHGAIVHDLRVRTPSGDVDRGVHVTLTNVVKAGFIRQQPDGTFSPARRMAGCFSVSACRAKA